MLLGACGGDEPVAKDTPKRQLKIPEGGEWLAVIRIEEDPNQLDRDTDELRKAAGKSLVVAQVRCFEGLDRFLEVPDEEGGEGAEDDTYFGQYLIGVRGKTRAKVERVMKKIDRDPIASGPVIDRCLGS